MRNLIALAVLASAVPALAQSESFDSMATGAAPDGWHCGVSGNGSPKWTVEAEKDAPSPPNVLKQTGSGTFPWCVKQGVMLGDGFVEVKFKPIAGREDQAGGLVWRFQDESSFYVARANALENNVSLYYMWHGWRRTLKYVNAPVPANRWSTLRVDFDADRIQVSLNGKAYIDQRDDHIKLAGVVGVWTKADSVTAFDDFTFGAKTQ
ncbi:MAG: family 16 glycoside hydrolase [Burkholderiales bacterium]